MPPGMLGRDRCVAVDRPRGDPIRLPDSRAEDDAVLWCDVDGKTNDCRVVVSGLGCLSIAESGDGKTLAGRQAFSQDAADAAALNGAGPGSTVDLNGCSGW